MDTPEQVTFSLSVSSKEGEKSLKSVFFIPEKGMYVPLTKAYAQRAQDDITKQEGKCVV